MSETASQLNLRFKRNDLWSIGTTHRGTLRVLPQGKRSRQKVVVGDNSGIATCFGLGKHHDIKTEFTTPKPLVANAEVTRIDLFGDQVFCAVGNRVCAFTKKGKPFFILETTMTEPIRQLRINTPYLYIAGDYMLTGFREASERGFFMCPDKINDSLSIARDDNGTIDVLAACQDRTVRTIRGNAIVQQMGCEAPVNALCFVKPPEPDATSHDIVYGTVGGSLGGLRVSQEGIARRFSAVPETRLGAVTGVASADVTQDGVCDILVARDDGALELHNFDKNPDGTPVSVWKGSVDEYVTSLDHGCVTNADREDFVVSTFSGKVLAFSVNEEDAAAQAVVPTVAQGAQSVQTNDTRAPHPDDQSAAAVVRGKTLETQAAITELKKVLAAKKSETSSPDGTPKHAVDKMRAVTGTFTMRDKLYLDDSATLAVAIELDNQIDSVAVESRLQLDVSEAASDNAVVSVAPKSVAPASSAKVLAVFRPAEAQCTRLVLHLRPVEGQGGAINAYVCAKTSPKCTMRRTFEVPPLCLHQRMADGGAAAADPALDPAMSGIRLAGSFSAKDMHGWLYKTLFDVPEMLQGEEGRLTYRNCFVGTELHVRYRRGEAEFYSYNLTTLAVVKEHIMHEATQRKIHVSMDSRIKPDSVPAMLRLLNDKIAKEVKITRAMKVSDALKEIQTQEPDISFLTQEYRDILANEKAVESESANHTKRMQYIVSLLERLLVDRAGFRGESVPAARIQELQQVLQGTQYTVDQLIAFFSH